MDVWPAFSDLMLAFVLVLTLLLVFQVGRNIQISSDAEVRLQQEIWKDQEQVKRIAVELQQRYGGIHSEVDGNSQEITFGGSTLFESGSADLHRQGRALLTELARRIVDAKLCTLREVTVKGHTDDARIVNRKFDSNWELSAVRATRIVRFFTESDPTRRIDPRVVTLVASAYGEFSPAGSDRSRNRRIEMRLVYTNRECGTR